MNINEAKKNLNSLPIFVEEIALERLEGGLSNYSFLVKSNNK